MADKNEDLDPGLEAFFAAARSDKSAVPEDLMARVLADADAAQSRAETLGGHVPDPGLASGFGWIEAMLAALGGWPAAAGLAAVAGVGVLVGYSPPDLLSGALDTVSLLGGVEDGTEWMLADYDAFLNDG